MAVEAARLLYRREFKEYYQAKREAARRQNTTVLPTNREIHDQLLLIADRTEGQKRTARLGSMRRRALTLMELLEDFQPRVIGSTWTGHIRQGSDIDLHLFSDELSAVTHRLESAGLAHQVEVVHSRKYEKEMEFVHIHLMEEEPTAVEMTVYPREWLKVHPKCSITGGPMARGTLNELRQKVAEEHPEMTGPVVAETQLINWLEPPIQFEELVEMLPELAACRAVEQNYYHHLDVFGHTCAVVRSLEGRHRERYRQLGPMAEPLLEHLEAPGPAGWSKHAVLVLAGLCHDIGKPSTSSRDRKGRIRFLGHEAVGEEMVLRAGLRLELPHSVSEAVSRLVGLHMEPILIPSNQSEPSRIYRMFREARELAPELLLLSLADVDAARGPEQPHNRFEEQVEFVKEMLEQFFENGFLRFPTPPLTGLDLAEELGVEEGRLRERLLERLTDAYIDGEYAGREDGLMWAADLLESPFSEWRG